MTETRILTKHPKGLKGVNILQRRHELIKEFILEKIVHHKKKSPIKNCPLWPSMN